MRNENSSPPELPDRVNEGIRRIIEHERKLEREADERFGRNGGVACDTFSGPCNCGAWH